MSIQSEIARLNAIKERMRVNLVAQGVTVPEDTVLATMAEMVLSVAGEDGYTPIKGEDYFTETDKQEIAEEAASLVKIPESVWEKVDGENGVRLKGTGGSASGNYAISAGDDKTASDGTEYKSVASGDHAVAFGFGNTCSGRTSLAQGLYNIVSANDSVAFGQKNTVYGTQSFAAGQGNEATARLTIVLGYGNKATMQNGIAIGWGNVASGDAAIAMGDSCESRGTSAVAMGYKTKASGDASATFGSFTKTTGKGEVAMGEYNQSVESDDPSYQTAFSFGIGTSDTERSNAFEIKKNGDVYFGGTKFSIDDCILTDADKQEIAEQAAALIDTSLLTAIGSGVIE